MATERRSYPRYPVQCPAQVLLAEADTRHPVTVDNLSRTSMQIECDADLVAGLLRQQKLPYTCQVEFALPWHDNNFSITAHVITQRRLSRQQYVLVMLLKHADPDQEVLLGDLLASRQPIGLD